LTEFNEDLTGELSLHDVYEIDKEEKERENRNKKQREYNQRPGVKERIKERIADRAVAKRIEKINKNEFTTCKKICLKYTAKKPITGSRYGSGQKRCQMCEVYITIKGTKNEQGLFCKCCNYRVRGKPRNKFCKENLRNKEEKESPKFRNAHEPWIDVNEDYSNMDNGNSSENKSVPINEEIDEFVKTFHEFKNFLDKIHLESNYQLVMLKELIEYGILNKGEIAESLAYFNNKNTTDINFVKYYFNVPVYDVLLKHGFVIKIDKNSSLQHYSLNVDLDQMQAIDLINYLSDEIIKYNKKHNIPDNEFPNSNNMGNFNWNNEF
jgi:hypothetical protein